MLNHSNDNEFDLHKNTPHFHLNDCAPGLALKLRPSATRKWATNLDWFIALFAHAVIGRSR